tara:strand:- start:17 stop:517 length:501 start_codon:yes stop_codon:yes gene_type:complete
MKNSKSKNSDTFQDQFKEFKLLILGSKMAKASSILLICFSVTLMFYSEKNVFILISLAIGIAVMLVYIFKFLSLRNIEQRSHTPSSLTDSLSKFKVFMKQRKKFEILYISIWFLSLVPFVSSYLGSGLDAIISIVLLIIITSILGMLAFIKADKKVITLENRVQSK